MGQYSINQFAQITGINKRLIRTWENRYKFLQPKRTSTNIRYYDDKMLTKGIKYSILVNNGLKISKLTKKNDEEINSLIENILNISKKSHEKYDIYISKFIESALHYDQEVFDKTYKRCLKDLGIINFYTNVLIQTMNKISILYLNTKITPANEHFFSSNIRCQLQHEIAATKTNIKFNDGWTLFLPENEYHDIGLLFSHLILKRGNHKIIYLGQNTPRDSLLDIQKKSKNFLFFLNVKTKKEFSQDLCLFLNNKIKQSKIYVVDRQKHINTQYSNIIRIEKVDELIDIIS